MSGADDGKVGLVCAGGEEENVPLTRVSVSCTVINLIANVSTTCTYKNNSDHQVDAKFVFPLNNVAVYSFEARMGDYRLVAKCRPREEAKVTYDQALATGHTTFMAEQDEHNDDLFQIRIGNIPSQATVFIVLKYVGHLDVENVVVDKKNHSRAIFTLPAALTPRYKPDYNKGKEGYENGSVSGGICPYTISFSANVMMSLKIVSVTAADDVYNVEWDSFDHRRAKVALLSEFEADHDLQMTILTEGNIESFAAVEMGGTDEPNILSKACIMAQFMPDFSTIAKVQDVKSEVIFIVDRSGYMHGQNIKFAADALLLFLKGLPKGCRFQIISYGDMQTSLFPEPVEYNAANSMKATEFQRTLKADLGGTELLPALNAAFRTPLPSDEWCKKVIILTSGMVSDGQELVGTIRSNNSHARVFVVGIGDGSNSYILASMARAGQGIAVSIRSNTQLRSEAMHVLNCAMQPRATNIEVKWTVEAVKKSGEITNIEVTSIPEVPPPIFKDCFTTVFGLFDQKLVGRRQTLSGQVQLECDVAGKHQKMVTTIPDFRERRLLSATVDFPLHRLAGKVMIDDMCDQQRTLLVTGASGEYDPEEDKLVADLCNRMEQLSSAINVLSPRTAYIAVDPVVHKPVKFAPPAAAPIFTLRSAPKAYAALHSTPYSVEAISPVGVSNGMQLKMAQPPTTQPIEKDVLTTLIELQTPDGSWLLDEQLAKSLSCSLKQMKEEIPESWLADVKAPVTEEVWATLLVLAYFDVELSHRSDEWDLLAKKSRDWLQEEALNAYPKMEDVEKCCLELLDEAITFLVSSQLQDDNEDDTDADQDIVASDDDNVVNGHRDVKEDEEDEDVDDDEEIPMPVVNAAGLSEKDAGDSDVFDNDEDDDEEGSVPVVNVTGSSKKGTNASDDLEDEDDDDFVKAKLVRS